MLPAPTACGELLVCMHDHMWYGVSFTSLYLSVIRVSVSPFTYRLMHMELLLV